MIIRRLALMLLVPISLPAQQPPVEALKPENGRIDSVYQLFSVRELRDGRVLIPGRGGKLEAINFATHQREPLPDVPASGLFALAGDSTLLANPGSAWIFLEGTRVLGMLPVSNPVVAAVQEPIGFDSDGNALGVIRTQTGADSNRIVRVSRSSGAVDVVGRLWAPGLPAGVPAPVFMVSEQAVAAPDGWIAVVRSHPYRVDWRTPAGAWVRGAPIDSSPTPMDQRQQDAYVARMVWTPPGGIHDWPSFVEPITYPAARIAPGAMVLAKRTPTADYPGARYDVIDRHGVLVRTVLVSTGWNDGIVGFGEHSVYVWASNSKHGALGHLERHPWP